MNLDKDISSWGVVKADAVMKMSHAAAQNVMAMALHDIAILGLELERVRGQLQRHCPCYGRTHSSAGWNCPDCGKTGPAPNSTCM